MSLCFPTQNTIIQYYLNMNSIQDRRDLHRYVHHIMNNSTNMSNDTTFFNEEILCSKTYFELLDEYGPPNYSFSLLVTFSLKRLI